MHPKLERQQVTPFPVPRELSLETKMEFVFYSSTTDLLRVAKVISGRTVTHNVKF